MSTATKRFHQQMEGRPWDRLHMVWLYEHECGNVPVVIADAECGRVEAFRCTDRSTRKTDRYLRTKCFTFGILYTVVSDDGSEISTKVLTERLTRQISYNFNTWLNPPRAKGLAEGALPISKLILEFFENNHCMFCGNLN